MNFKKMSAKALSVFMSLIMLFSLVAPAVSAAVVDDHNHGTEKPNLNYVSLGDSMSNGYGLDGYAQDKYFDIFADEEIGHYGEGAYTLQFEKYLAEIYNVNHSKLATSAMLSRDLLFLVGGGKYVEDNYYGFMDYLGVHHNDVDDAFLERLQALYIEKITEADVITMGLGNAEFGAYIMHRLMDCIGFNYPNASFETVAPYVQLEALMETCDPELVEKAIEVRDMILAELPQIGDFSDEQVETIANLFVYTILDFCNNYTKILDRIVELNPDVEIVVIGLMNTVNGMQFKFDENTTVDFGEYMGYFLDVVNAHLTTYATVQVFGNEAYKDATIYFAEESDVEVIVETFHTGKLSDVVRDRFHSEIVGRDGVANGLVWSLNPALPYITLDQIKEFEADRVAFYNALETQMGAAGAQQYVNVFQFYLAVEKAIMEASEGATLGFDSLVALSDLPNSEAFAKFAAAAGINFANGTLGNYEDSVILAYVEANEDEIIGGFKNEITENFKVTGCPNYLTNKFTIYNMLTKYVYESEDLVAFFDDLDNLSEKQVVNKIALAIYSNYYTPILDTLNPDKDYLARAKSIAQGIYDSANAQLVELGGNYVACYFMTDYMADELCADETLKGLLNFLGRCKIGNGIGTHPSAVGHNDLFDAVRKAYVNQHTVVDETVDNIVLVRDFIYENYKEIYAYVYDMAVEEGVIAELDAYLVDAINAVRYAENWAYGYEEYFRSEDFALQISISADSTVATIEALRAVLANADELDADLYDSIVALLANLETNLADLAALINAAIADAYAYGAPIVEAELAKALAFINAKVNAVLEVIACIEAKVQEQIAIAEAMIADFIATAEAYLAQLLGDIAGDVADAKDYLKNAKAYLNALLNAFLSNSAFSANYIVNADSYYVAIGGDDALYAELLAAKMGLDDKYTAMNWNNLDSSIIAKADLITIGYTESMISGFATEQIIAYIANYIDVTLRDSANNYADEALNHFFGQMTPAPSEETVKNVLANLAAYLNDAFDGVLTETGLAGAEIADMDWAALVGAENVAYIDEAIASITGALVEAGLPATFTQEINVLDLLLDKLDEIDPSIAAMIAYFDVEEVKAMFGDYATYTLEIPVADAIAFAVESYLYSYVKFNVEYAQLVYAVNAINPDAQIVLLGNYNAFAGLGFDFVVDGVSIDLGEIFTADIQDSANAYANEVFEKIFAALDYATKDETIDSVLGSVDSAIVSGASTLYDIILGVLADAEAVRDYIDGTVVALPEISVPEISVPSCPALENLVALLGKVNFKALADIDWEKLIGVDVNGAVEGVVDGAAEAFAEAAAAIQNAIAEIENTLVELGIFESYTITLPTLDFIYDNLDKFDAETRALLESLDYEEVRAMLGDLADYVVEVKTLSVKALDYVNGLYNQLAETEITVFEGATIDLGELLSAPTSIHSLFYAFTMKNVIYVDIADAEVAYEADSILDFIAAYILDNSVADVTEAGNAYIAEQIYAALNVECGHYDLDNDHYCDNKVCGEKLTDCVDADKDHKCDICGAEISECADTNKDHNCDYCGKKVSDCVDANKDHNCDICGKKLSDCADANKDHNCDICGKKLSDCADANNDHKCDTCGAVLSECADKNADGKCDVCGADLGTVKPEDPEDPKDPEGPKDPEEPKTGRSAGVVVAITAGSAVVTAALGFAGYWFIFKKRIFS
ncbi:MAG: hypothetical protein IJD59_11000 [Clostridia bacterium]|nr:hypothetical protein [Clostridia bacterium]